MTELTLVLCRVFCGWALFLQNLELIQVKHAYKDDGIWAWPIVRSDFEHYPRLIKKILDFFMSYKIFVWIPVAQVVLSIVMMFFNFAIVPPVILFFTLLICLRFRGTFNGGSDYMTVVLLLGLSLTPQWGMAYIVVQCLLSYFVAGIVKLKNKQWRNGTALKNFLTNPQYNVPKFVFKIVQNSTYSKTLSWCVIGFEVLAPMVFVFPAARWIFVPIVAMFHLVNVYVLGLNRFFWIWLASYPALFYVLSR